MYIPDKAVVVSLRSSEARRVYMKSTNRRLGFTPEFLDAVDGHAVQIPNSWLSSPAAYGNAQSHRAALASANGSILVLEDDAHIPGDFQARLTTVLNAAPDWEVIMLGGEHITPPVSVGPGTVRCTTVIRSIGYLMRGDVIRKSIQAIDLSQRHWDTEWSKVLASVNTYAPDPFIIRPNGLPSTIPDSTPYR